MKRKPLLLALAAGTAFAACRQTAPADDVSVKLNAMFDHYYEDRLKLYPLEATSVGDNRYNDRLPNDNTQAYRDSTRAFYTRYLDSLNTFDTARLTENDRVSYDIFHHEMQINLDGFRFKTWLMPIHQFWGMTISFPQMGSGDGIQPFKNTADYDHFLQRIHQFPAWADSAIANMRTGITQGYVLPHALTVKVIPELTAIVVKDPTQSIFYGPIKKLAQNHITDTATVNRLTQAYTQAIRQEINPAYQRLATFFQQEYLPKSRTSSGIDSVPDGAAYYQYLIRLWTTTDQTPDAIFALGQKEVARIRTTMDSIRAKSGFTGDLNAFFTYLRTDKKFKPFTTPQQVIDAFWNIKKREDPQLKKLFNHTPKTPFEIRQTEAFRAASASAEYNQGSADGTRPGIFYVPILDPKTYNYTGMETLFLHEAIPGHHYQISIQQEDTALPQFRRFVGYGAYQEGWALYCESLGEELGLYTDPYAKMGNLSDEIHRAIRLVVDVGLHAKGWTREQAIKYMLDNEPTSEQEATAEIERYMAIPGQALSYKIGALKIRELRNRYQQQLGAGFSIAGYHDAVIGDGCMPLQVLEKKLDRWAARQSSK